MANKYDSIIAALGKTFRLRPSKTNSGVVSDEELDKIENRIGHSLPDDYRDFLKHYGGWIFSEVPFPVHDESNLVAGSIFLMYGASLDEDNIAEHYSPASDDDSAFPSEYYPGLRLVRELTPDLAIGWPNELLPIGSSGGGDFVCLALSGLRPGAIFYWVNAPDNGSDNVYLVADSFDEFMHLLGQEV